MQKKLTITVDEKVYEGLHAVIGRRNISRFLSDLAKPHVLAENLAKGYQAMAEEEEREKEAREWSEALIGDAGDVHR